MFSVGILTISDKGSRGEREDRGGPEISAIISANGGDVVITKIVPDERTLIEDTLRAWGDELHLDLILTTGGTGLSSRDVTPEATRAIIDREVPGIAEAMRLEGLKKTPHAMLSRGIAGTRGHCLIVNLPGSPRAVRENLQAVIGALPHAIDIIKGIVTEHTS